jgi:hypothetical protein
VEREQEAVAMNALESETAPDWEQIRPLLDEALDELGRNDRDALLLRFFEQRSLAEVGNALGSNEDAARKRVSRALEKLRARLTRRGVTTSAVALSAALPIHAIQVAPAGLAATLTSASLAGAAAGSGTTLTLLKLMATTKLKAGIVSAMVVASVVTSLVIQHQSQAKMREAEVSLQQQADQLAQLTAENERLANLVRPPANSQEELLRLRNEAAELRNQAAMVRDENRQLQAALLRAQLRTNALTWQPEGILVEAKDKLSYCAQLSLAMAQYAADHQDQFPTNFAQAATEVTAELEALFKKQPNLTNFTTDQFEIVYQGSRRLPNFANNIILIREKKPWKSAAGHWAKVYFYANGGGTALSAADGDFEAYEKQHIIPIESSKP